MAKGREAGMQTFDQALFQLYEAGAIGCEDALRNADSVNEVKLQYQAEQQPRPGGEHPADGRAPRAGGCGRGDRSRTGRTCGGELNAVG